MQSCWSSFCSRISRFSIFYSFWEGSFCSHGFDLGQDSPTAIVNSSKAVAGKLKSWLGCEERAIEDGRARPVAGPWLQSDLRIERGFYFFRTIFSLNCGNHRTTAVPIHKQKL